MDETRHQNWADRQTKVCSITENVTKDHVYVLVSQSIFLTAGYRIDFFYETIRSCEENDRVRQFISRTLTVRVILLPFNSYRNPQTIVPHLGPSP
jgi:hypothetical protein